MQLGAPLAIQQTRMLVHAAGLLAIALTVGGAYLAIFRPMQSRQVDCRRELQALQDDRFDSRNVSKELERTTSELAVLNRELAQLQAAIPPALDESQFLAYLADTAAQCSVLIQSFQPGAATRNKGFGRSEVTLQCDGGYAGICRFLHQLSVGPRASRCVRLQVQRTSGSSSYPFSLTLQIFFAEKSWLSSGGKS